VGVSFSYDWCVVPNPSFIFVSPISIIIIIIISLLLSMRDDSKSKDVAQTDKMRSSK